MQNHEIVAINEKICVECNNPIDGLYFKTQCCNSYICRNHNIAQIRYKSCPVCEKTMDIKSIPNECQRKITKFAFYTLPFLILLCFSILISSFYELITTKNRMAIFEDFMVIQYSSIFIIIMTAHTNKFFFPENHNYFIDNYINQFFLIIVILCLCFLIADIIILYRYIIYTDEILLQIEYHIYIVFYFICIYEHYKIAFHNIFYTYQGYVDL